LQIGAFLYARVGSFITSGGLSAPVHEVQTLPLLDYILWSLS